MEVKKKYFLLFLFTVRVPSLSTRIHSIVVKLHKNKNFYTVQFCFVKKSERHALSCKKCSSSKHYKDKIKTGRKRLREVKSKYSKQALETFFALEIDSSGLFFSWKDKHWELSRGKLIQFIFLSGNCHFLFIRHDTIFAYRDSKYVMHVCTLYTFLYRHKNRIVQVRETASTEHTN